MRGRSRIEPLPEITAKALRCPGRNRTCDTRLGNRCPIPRGPSLSAVRLAIPGWERVDARGASQRHAGYLDRAYRKAQSGSFSNDGNELILIGNRNGPPRICPATERETTGSDPKGRVRETLVRRRFATLPHVVEVTGSNYDPSVGDSSPPRPTTVSAGHSLRPRARRSVTGSTSAENRRSPRAQSVVCARERVELVGEINPAMTHASRFIRNVLNDDCRPSTRDPSATVPS
jgi:hypothetical protein